MAIKRHRGGAGGSGASDEALVRSIVSGDRAAFVVLMRRYDQLLYRTARSILGNDAEAEDALQEGYLLAYRAIPKFRRQAKLSTWLVRIVANEALGRLRKARKSTVLELDDAVLQQWRDANVPKPDTPDEALSRADARRLLEVKIDALPAHYRVVFVLRAVHEFSVAETSQALGIPQATVRSRFVRARRLLRDALSRDVETALLDIFPFAGARCDQMVDAVMAALNRSRGRPVARVETPARSTRR